jgi:hypothetical protein
MVRTDFMIVLKRFILVPSVFRPSGNSPLLIKRGDHIPVLYDRVCFFRGGKMT